MNATLRAAAALLLTAALALPAFALKPKREYTEMPDKYNMKYEERTIPSTKGASLHAWIFPCPTAKTKSYVILSHSGDGNMADYLDRINRFLSGGYNVVAYDYRGFGKSSDFEIDENMYVYPEFCDDFNAVCDYVKTNLATAMYCYGFGVGAGLTMGVGLHRKEIKKLAVEAPFTTLQALSKNTRAAGTEVKVPDIGYNKQYEPEYALDAKVITVEGVYIVHGDADPVFNGDVYKALQKKNKKLITLKTYKGVDNRATYLDDKDKYVQDVVAFFKGA